MTSVHLEAELRCDALEAFDLFEAAIGDWWGEAAAAAAAGDVELEPRAGGRLVEARPPPGGDPELGRMKLWRPGSRLEAEWREPSWPEAALTWITASFEATGSTTRIVVEHGGFEQLAEAADSVAWRYERLWRELLDSLSPALEG
jgi:uncharacterized protein YndB with AHSA1/START domain